MSANPDTATSKTGITIQNAATGVSVQGNTTGIGVANAGSVAGTNAPYVEFLACQKN